MKSIITDDWSKCYYCGSTWAIQAHHCIYGKNRKWSDKYGLIAPLCIDHHTGQHGVHNGNTSLDLKLKQIAQDAFELEFPDLDFRQIFGKSYSN